MRASKKQPVLQVARAFLAYAFRDIDFDYNDLTDTEKSLCTEEEFKTLVAWIRNPLSFAK